MTFWLGFAVGFIAGLRTVGQRHDRRAVGLPQSGFDYRDPATWQLSYTKRGPDGVWFTYTAPH